MPRPNNEIVSKAASSLVKLLKQLTADNRGRITTKSSHLIKLLIESDHGRDAAEWAILQMVEVRWLTPFVSVWGGVIDTNRKSETRRHRNQPERFAELKLSQQDFTLLVEEVFWKETAVPEIQEQNEIMQPHLTDTERRSMIARFVFLAEKFLRDIDASKTTDFRVLGLPPALVDEMEDICIRLGISKQNLPLKIENGHANEIRKRLSDEKVTDTTDMVSDGLCYTASPYGDALQDVLWHWVFESGDGSIMRHDIEPDHKWNHFANTLKRNLGEWVEYLMLQFAADRPTDDNNLGRHDAKAEFTTVPPILEVDAVKLTKEASKQSATPDSNPNPPPLKTNRKRAGRKQVTKITPLEKKIQQTWKTRNHATHGDCDRALGLEIGTTKTNLDRLRKRIAGRKS